MQPISADGSSVRKSGSNIPAKFRVCDANGASVGTPGVVRSFFLIRQISGTAIAISTKTMQKDMTYVYAIALNDGSTIGFSFGLK